MTTEPKPKPIPRPDELSKPFWEAANQGRLALQKCSDCGYFNHPPKALCDKCSSEHLAFQDVSGRGTIASYTVMHQFNVPGYEGEVPYINILVELAEQPQLFMITNMRGAAMEDVKIGLPVEVTFERVTDDIQLPQFRVVKP